MWSSPLSSPSSVSSSRGDSLPAKAACLSSWAEPICHCTGFGGRDPLFPQQQFCSLSGHWGVAIPGLLGQEQLAPIFLACQDWGRASALQVRSRWRTSDLVLSPMPAWNRIATTQGSEGWDIPSSFPLPGRKHSPSLRAKKKGRAYLLGYSHPGYSFCNREQGGKEIMEQTITEMPQILTALAEN